MCILVYSTMRLLRLRQVRLRRRGRRLLHLQRKLGALALMLQVSLMLVLDIVITRVHVKRILKAHLLPQTGEGRSSACRRSGQQRTVVRELAVTIEATGADPAEASKAHPGRPPL